MLLFSDIASVFAEIEKKSGRLEMTDVLAALFKRSTPGEMEKLVYLIQGIIAPPYEGIDLGVGEKFAIEAIASAAGYSRAQVETHYKKSGDLGDSAEELLTKRKQTALAVEEMGVKYVYDAMMRIAKASGSGSQDQKIKILTELLNNSNPLEARYVIRFVLGRLRLGVGNPTILDAISVSSAGNKSLREPLEHAYNVCADMGHVAKTFFENPKAIAAFHVTPFKPLMPALAERLSTPAEIIERLKICGTEFKYDGFRMQVHKSGERVEIYSRNLERMSPMFPDIVEAVRKLKPRDIIFEGEALAYDTKKKRYFPFQQTMHRRRKHGIEAASEDFPLNVFVFDIIYLEGKDLTGEPYKERRGIIERLFKSAGLLRPSASEIIDSAKDLNARFKEAIAQGLEGIMAKDLDAPYTAGKRKFAWIKLKKSYGKSVDTIDGVVVGYYLGKGQRTEFDFSGALVAVFNPDSGKLETVAKVASGFTEEEMVDFAKKLEKIKTSAPPAKLEHKIGVDFWVEPRYVVEVAFDDITQSPNHTCGMKDGKGYALRFPRMLKIRTDKGLREITTTDEVIRLYELQHAR
ncbi:MAG: ATP-dependent DNA ligase [Candidatus Micrarchaeota archaeon]